MTAVKVGDQVHLAGDDTSEGPHVHVYKVVHVLRETAAESHWATIRDLTAIGGPLQTVAIDRLTLIDQ